MEKKFTIELTECELNSVVHCLNERGGTESVAKEWRAEYMRLALMIAAKTEE